MQDKWRNTDLSVCLYWPEFLALYHSGLKWSPRSRPCMIFQFLTQIQSKVTNLENKLGMLEDGHSNTCKTVEGLIEDGLNALNTTVNEAKAAREKLKVDCEQKCKELEDKLLYAEVYSRRENLQFYGICEEGDRWGFIPSLISVMNYL